MKGNVLNDSIRTKLYFVVFFLFSSYLAVIIYTAYYDAYADDFVTIGGMRVFRPHAGRTNSNLASTTDLYQ